MENSKMKEIINWTLRHSVKKEERDSVSVIREILSNCGISLPNGTAHEILQTMMSNDYMGWKNCTYAQAQELADSGEAVVGVNSEKVVLLKATEADPSYDTESSEYVANVSVLSTQELSGMQFFSTSSTGTTTTSHNALQITGIPSGDVYVGQSFALAAYLRDGSGVSASWEYDNNKFRVWYENRANDRIAHFTPISTGNTTIKVIYGQSSRVISLNLIMHKITLDAGHGLYTAGKQTPPDKITGKITKEWTLNQKVCNYVTDYLKNYNVEIYRVDDVQGKAYDEYPYDKPLEDRTNMINQIKPELSISVHHNGYGNGIWDSANGVEVYSHLTKPTRDAHLAQLFVDEIAKNTGLRNRGAKKSDFHMIREPDDAIPSVLTEGGFMTNENDYSVIMSEAGQRAYARAIANVCISYLSLLQYR